MRCGAGNAGGQAAQVIVGEPAGGTLFTPPFGSQPGVKRRLAKPNTVRLRTLTTGAQLTG